MAWQWNDDLGERVRKKIDEAMQAYSDAEKNFNGALRETYDVLSEKSEVKDMTECIEKLAVQPKEILCP